MNKQPISRELPTLESHPALAETASRLFYWAATESDAATFLRQALPLVAQTLGGEYLALVQGAKGQWRTIAASGPHRTVPAELTSEALDSDQPVVQGEWHVGPLTPQSASGELLAAFRTWNASVERGGTLETLTQWLAIGLAQVKQRQRDRQRLARQSALLEIAAQWTQTLQMGKLLARMAEAATRLLAAERASIFLWDKRAHTLIGRPALGVEGGELRIGDDSGIVGQVVQTGEPRRVDADIAAEQRQIDRRIDERLKFQTRSILCVPLRGKSGELFGAFELLNKVGGNFTAHDEEALTELATHAAVALENTQQWEQLLS